MPKHPTDETEPLLSTAPEWAAYLTGVLQRLDTLAARTPELSELGGLVNDARERVATLIGYFIG